MNREVNPTMSNAQAPPVTVMEPSDTESIAESLTPYFGDNKQTKYLSYRASGFSVREACEMVGITQKTAHRWREASPAFNTYDTTEIGKLRKELGGQFAYTEFLRNFRLIMEKDRQVLTKSVKPESAEEMTRSEEAYLLKSRGFYTPQQLEVIRQVLVGDPGESGANQFDFTALVMHVHRSGNGDGTTHGNS